MKKLKEKIMDALGSIQFLFKNPFEKKAWESLKDPSIEEGTLLKDLKEAFSFGIDFNEPNEKGELLLHHCFAFPNVLSFLLENQADPLKEDSQGKNAFFYTLDPALWELLCKFCKEGAYEKIISFPFLTFLIDEKRDSLDCSIAISYLLEKNPNLISEVEKKWPDLLPLLVEDNTEISLEIAEVFIENGLPLQEENVDSPSFTTAIEIQNISFILFLLNQPLQISKELWNHFCLSTFQDAVLDENKKNLACLILENVDLTVYEWTDLHFASLCGLDDWAFLLIKKNPSNVFEKKVFTDETPLHLAVKENRLYTSFILLDNGKADPNAEDKNGELPNPKFETSPLISLLSIYRKEKKPNQETLRSWVNTSKNLLQQKQEQLKSFPAADFYIKEINLQIEELKKILEE